MKVFSSAQNTQNSLIRANRLRMRENIKFNRVQHEKKKNQSGIIQTQNQAKTVNQTYLLVLNRVGLIQKEYIQGIFEDSYDLNEKIGEGAHASVYRCTQKSTGKDFAVKITKQMDQQLIEGSKVQFKILKNLDHENVMKAQAFYTDRAKLTTYLVCELCSYPELAVHLRNRKNKFLSEAQATTIMASILKTLQYLHQKGVCHRDLKPQNILYDPETKKIKVIDFDCAIKKPQLDSKFEMWTKTGSFHYQAPETFNSTIYNQKVDVWAAGVIAYELITGTVPFNSNYYKRMIKMITEDQISIDTLNVSEDYKLLLNKMLQKDPSKRYTAAECLRLPAALKVQQVHNIKTLDDFFLKFKAQAGNCPRSQKQICMRSSETTTCGKQSRLPPLLKFFCFVSADL